MKNIITLFWKNLTLNLKKYGERFAALSPLHQYAVIFLSLLVIIFFFWEFVEKSGDAIHKWRMVRALVEHGSLMVPPDHHSLRWALLFPAVCAAKIFGTEVYVYYIFPMLNYCIAGTVFFALCKKIFAPHYAPFAVAVFALHPTFINEGTQFLPIGAAATWIFLALLLIIHALEKKKHSTFVAFCAGICLIFAYGCKESSLFWMFGILFFLAFQPDAGQTLIKCGKIHFNSLMLILILCCIAGIVAETLIINSIYGVSHGRLELIRGTHLAGMSESGKSVSMLEYIFSPLRMLRMRGKYFVFLSKNFYLVTSVAGCIFVLAKNYSRNAKFLAASALGALFIHCYGIIKLNPITYPENVYLRYFAHATVIGTLLYLLAIPQIWKTVCIKKYSKILFFFFNVSMLTIVSIYDLNQRCKDGTIWQVIQMKKVFCKAAANGDAIGFITPNRYCTPNEYGRCTPEKWAQLHLSLFWKMPQYFQFIKDGCHFSEYDSDNKIFWAVPPSTGKKQILIKKYQVSKIIPAETSKR